MSSELKFIDYGTKFGEGDVVGCYIDYPHGGKIMSDILFLVFYVMPILSCPLLCHDGFGLPVLSYPLCLDRFIKSVMSCLMLLWSVTYLSIIPSDQDVRQ